MLKLKAEHIAKLHDNYTANVSAGGVMDFPPVVKIFTPDGNCTWLLSELDPDGIAFGLCDLGMGFPELGYVELDEIKSIRGALGLPAEVDRHFVAKHPLSEYANIASRVGYIQA